MSNRLKIKAFSLALVCLIGVQPAVTYPSGFQGGSSDEIRMLAQIVGSLIGVAFSAVITSYVVTWMQKRTMSVDVGNKPVAGKEGLRDYIGTVPEEVLDLVAQLKDFESYKAMNVPMIKGILLHGDPGCGKTHLARAIAGEVDCPFFAINATYFSQTYLGQGRMAVESIFLKAKEAAAKHKSKVAIIFIDEFDAVGSREDKNSSGAGMIKLEIINTLLSEMDGFDNQNEINVVVIGATNFIDNIDPAIRRTGRFDKTVHVASLSEEGRKEMIDAFLKNRPSENDLSSDIMAQISQGMSPADIKELFNSAGTIAIRAHKKCRDKESFVRAFFTLRESKRAQRIASSSDRTRLIGLIIKNNNWQAVDLSVEGLVNHTNNMTLEDVASIFSLAEERASKQQQALRLDHIVAANLLVEDRLKKNDVLEKIDISKKMYQLNDDAVDIWVQKQDLLRLQSSDIIDCLKLLAS